MPIRPENAARYPAAWASISHAIKERAEWRCECEGECGRGYAYGTGSTVVLTVAHLDHAPENCGSDNLRAMCQGCHLHYDIDHHAATRARTVREALEAAGQLMLDG
jgi:hypothetical protein